jgi:4-hydroxy-tetrahydrodipicolinate synthase
MVTPFDGEGALDLDAAASLARWLAGHGSDGLVVAGTTGEGSTLTDEEKLDLWRAVAGAVTVPVIANTGSNDTAHSVHLTAQAAACGAAGVLAVTPYYNRPSQAGIEAHFRAVAAATDLPVLLYDIPVRSGRKIAHDVMVRLAREVPNMAGVKDAAAGVVGVATHWAGVEMGELIAAVGKGDLGHAREVNARLLESFEFETGDAAPNPIPAKAMMRTLGLAVGECRLPMGDAPEGLEARAREVYANLHA